MVDVDEILKKYGSKIESQVDVSQKSDYSSAYMKFKEELSPELSGYEKACKKLGSSIKMKLNKRDEEKIAKATEEAHLDVSPSEVAGLAIFSFVAIMLVSIFLIIGAWLITDKFSMLALFLSFVFGIFVYTYLNSAPKRLAQSWRLKASSQMVPCILYCVVYMRHTSNLELAIKFASEHLQPPLALDLKKIFWDVETGKYSTIKTAIDAYLEKWRDYSLEFVESFHLIESSLYEPNEARRIEILEKALTVILEGVHDKMLKYTHDIQSPLTNLYMLGIVLPTLAIAMLPLASTLLGGAITWIHVAVLFNLIVPFFVFYLTSQVLDKRPGGHGEEELLEMHPEYAYYKSSQHYKKAALIALPFILIGLIPLLFQFTALPGLLGLKSDYSLGELGFPIMQDTKFFDFKSVDGGFVGPFGLGAVLLSLFIPIGVSLFFISSYKAKTQRLLKTRDNTKALEDEFASSLFQLGNRLGEGIPAEMAFGRVAESLRGTPTASFFSTVNSNIQQFGMSVKQAVFNPVRGAIIQFPSRLINTSMEIMLESVKKGLEVAARALMSISQYVKNIHKVNERLKDLLADIISSMKSNMNFLAPLLAGIVVGLAAMITAILNRLQSMLTAGVLSQESALGGLGSVGAITTMFDVTKMIPPYYLQIAVGIYLVEIVFILTKTLVSVESGVDQLGEKAGIAENLKKSISLYSIASLIAILALSILAGVAVSGMAV